MAAPDRYRLLSRISAVVGVAAGLLALLTLVNAEWIEALTGLDPDHGSGTLEAFVVVGLALVALLAGAVSAWARWAAAARAAG